MKQVAYQDEIVHFDSQLVLHDKGNLAFQVVKISDNLQELKTMAENLNNMFLQAGHANQFEAMVDVECVPVYRWQVDGLG